MNYTGNHTMLNSATTTMRLEEYLKESLNPIAGLSLWESFFYKEDIPSVDPKTGRKWSKTFKTTKSQGPGGSAKFTDAMWKGGAQPGLLGNMIPNDQEYTIETQFNFASIGRSFQDMINDPENLYDAIKNAQFGEHIREQHLEEIKSAIFEQGVKTYAGNVADEDALTAASVLTWSDLSTFVEALKTIEIHLIDNRKRVSVDFVNSVKSITSINSGANALGEANVIDYNAWKAAQKTFEEAGMRTYRVNSPKFNISGLPSNNYTSQDINIDNIKITAPDMKSLFSFKKNQNQSSPMVVLTSANGYQQLWNDPTFLELVSVSGYKYEAGISGRHNQFITDSKSINVQGLLIVNMDQDYIHGSIASQGIDYGVSKNTDGVPLDAVLVATPGYNFITEASEFGMRTTIKTFDSVDSIDRMGFLEHMYMIYTWGIQILTPSSFNLLIHAGK